MTQIFATAPIHHVLGNPRDGGAAHRVLSRQGFQAAREEITAWEGHAPTPLIALDGLATNIGVARIDYKHEGPRFGLGSFKALGGAYAAMRVLGRELSRRLGHEVTARDIRDCRYVRDCAQITLISATDGNHGRSLAWGCRRFGAALMRLTWVEDIRSWSAPAPEDDGISLLTDLLDPLARSGARLAGINDRRQSFGQLFA